MSPLMSNGVQVDINAKNNASPVIKQVASDVQALETQNGSLGASAESAGEGFAGMGLSLSQLGSVMSIVTTAVSALVAAFEFGEIAAGNERLAASGEQLANSYGESMDNIVAKVSEASLGTVSNMDIITSSNKAMMLGVGGSAEQLANLMEIAAFRGRAMGLSTSQAFDDMTRGIGRMSPMILDNLGIVVDAESTYGAYAEQIGKSSSELTRAEKVQALLNKVLEEGNKQLDAAGGLVEDNASKYERFNAELENTKNSLIENTIGMSDLAGSAAYLLESFTEITGDQSLGEMYVKNATLVNAYQIAIDFLGESVDRSIERRYAERDAIEAHGDALDGIVPKITTLAQAEEMATEVSGEAVKGAMQVHDTYEKLGDKMTDLQVDHTELLAKKKELIDLGWWPESEKIQDVNQKLADNEQAQLDVTKAMEGTLTQMLLNTAAAGLDAEGQLALARATGQIDDETYNALTAQGLLKKEYEEGGLTAQEYAEKTIALKDAVSRLESKNIEVTVDAIFQEMRIITTSYVSKEGVQEYASGTDGWEMVPSGYPNDTYPIMLSSGERFAVIPAGVSAAPSSVGGMGGGSNIYITYAPGMSFGNEQDAVNNLYSTFLSMLEKARGDGHI